MYAALLREPRADPDVRDGDGWTPLHYAAICGHEAVAVVLLERGADKDAKCAQLPGDPQPGLDMECRKTPCASLDLGRLCFL